MHIQDDKAGPFETVHIRKSPKGLVGFQKRASAVGSRGCGHLQEVMVLSMDIIYLWDPKGSAGHRSVRGSTCENTIRRVEEISLS